MINLSMNGTNQIEISCKHTNNKAIITVDNHLLSINGKPCYRFHAFSELLRDSLLIVFADYKPKKSGKFAHLSDPHYECVLGKWKKKNLVTTWQKKLSKAFRPMWQALLATADQEIVNLDKGVWRATGPKTNYVGFTDLLTRIKTIPYAIKDATNYVPACLFYLNSSFQQRAIHSADWKEFFAFEGKLTGQLTKTLMGIKYPIRWDYLSELNTKKLERPLLSRTELYAVLNCRPYFLPIVWKSSKDDILKAVRYFEKLSGRKINCANYRSFRDFWLDLNDYPEHYNGTLKGLVKRSHDWHSRQARDRIARDAQRYGHYPEELAAKPPFDLDKLPPEIKFLDTVGRLNEEGAEMGHCVASYARSAVSGKSFIFSISKDKERATLELVPSPWRVNQSRGRNNSSNKATKWAERWFYKFINKEQLNVAV